MSDLQDPARFFEANRASLRPRVRARRGDDARADEARPRGAPRRKFARPRSRRGVPGASSRRFKTRGTRPTGLGRIEEHARDLRTPRAPRASRGSGPVVPPPLRRRRVRRVHRASTARLAASHGRGREASARRARCGDRARRKAGRRVRGGGACACAPHASRGGPHRSGRHDDAAHRRGPRAAREIAPRASPWRRKLSRLRSGTRCSRDRST